MKVTCSSVTTFLVFFFVVGAHAALFAQTVKPIANRDTASTMAEVPILVKPLLNDSSSYGGTLTLGYVLSARHGKISSRTDSSFIYISVYYSGLDSVPYTCRDDQNHVSDIGFVVIHVLTNPVLPFASNDSASVLSADSLLINILTNDFDPVGDSLQIDPTYKLTSAHKSVLKRLNDSIILYRANSLYNGRDEIQYRVRKKNDTTLYSNFAKVNVQVELNPDVPLAVNDTIDYLSYGNTIVDVLKNDYLPTSDSLNISFGTVQAPNMTLQPNQTLLYRDSVLNSNEMHVFSYSLHRKHDKVYSSNMAQLYVRYQNNPDYFYARPDTLSVNTYDTLKANILGNDYQPSPQSKLFVESISGDVLGHAMWLDQTFYYIPYTEFGGSEKLTYILMDSTHPTIKSEAPIFITLNNQNTAYLDVNNVKARFNARGNQFGPINGQGFEVPKGSGKHTIFNHIPWIGGMDEEDSLHFAGGMYGQGPTIAWAWTKWDYFVGPIMKPPFYTEAMDSAWNYIWKVTKDEVEYHRTHFSDASYQVPHDILKWPGNGDVLIGQNEKLAPFYDLNNNGLYEPLNGDYPAIRGDQALFFIFNDDRGFHTETQGPKMGIEIHGLAYAYNLMNDTAFKNTVFLNYTIINRTNIVYHNTWFGFFTDVDLGYSSDDYLQCDVERNLFITYNADSIDGHGGGDQYAKHPPAQGVILIGGPRLDPDGIDNPSVDDLGNQLCNESVNGHFFGDFIVDNERFGLRRFLPKFSFPFNWDMGWYYTNYYQVLNGLWMDSTRFQYGGNGHPSAGSYGPDCDFLYPGRSDTSNWGTECIPPNGLKDWTEEKAGNNPSDRTGIMATGPITFYPGDKVEIDLAFPWARDLQFHRSTWFR
jgi:hypothetical protein